MDFLLHLFTIICITLPTTLGYNLAFGKGKILHFGQLGVALAAAYPMWITVKVTGSFALGFGVGLGFALLLGLLLAWLSFRLEPDGLGVMSIAVHLALLAVALNWQAVTRGALGIPQIPRPPFALSSGSFAALAGTVALCFAYLLSWVHRSPIGRALAALSEHEWHAEALGVSRRRIHLVALLIASTGAALTNMLFPPYISLLHPNDYTFPNMIFLVMCIVAGGPGNVRGVLGATAILILLREGLRFVPLSTGILGPVRLILFGVILFGAVWMRRNTLFPQRRNV